MAQAGEGRPQPCSPRGHGLSHLGHSTLLCPQHLILGLWDSASPRPAPLFQNVLPAASRSVPWAPPAGLTPREEAALGLSPLCPPHRATQRLAPPAAQRVPPPLLSGETNQPPAAAGLGHGSQGGGFTLSPPQTGQVEKKAGGSPAWGLPASQAPPGASLPGASAACPRRLMPSQPEGHPADAWPPKSPAPPSSGLPCAVAVWSLASRHRLRGVS